MSEGDPRLKDDKWSTGEGPAIFQVDDDCLVLKKKAIKICMSSKFYCYILYQPFKLCGRVFSKTLSAYSFIHSCNRLAMSPQLISCFIKMALAHTSQDYEDEMKVWVWYTLPSIWHIVTWVLRKHEGGAHLVSSGEPIACLFSTWFLDLMALGGPRNASPTSHPSPNVKFIWGTFAY